MKRNTIKWRIFQYNLLFITMLILLVIIIFNVAIRMYIEKDIISQLDKITSHTVETALRQGPALFNGPRKPAPPADNNNNGTETRDDNDKNYRYYFMLNRALREPLSLLNAEYLLLDKEKSAIPFPEEIPGNDSSDFFVQLVNKIQQSSKNFNSQEHFEFKISGTDYIAVVRPLSQRGDFGLGWIIIYSSLQKLNQLQFVINFILIAILIFSSITALFLTAELSKKITLPFYSLTEHIKSISERDFGSQIDVPVYEELQEVVSSINIMSDKLANYDKAQKTFLQNVSHEFRTPLMSIQSYTEGIKYHVVDSTSAVDIILNETKRMTNLLEELLYLSRLDAIAESYHFEAFSFRQLITRCIDRLSVIATNNNISITVNHTNLEIELIGDEEKLTRAFTNIISNCIRYAKTTVNINFNMSEKDILNITIRDDGDGFDQADLPNLFERFYKGKKGNLGLGLAISKNIIEKHNGTISAENHDAGGALFLVKLPIKPGSSL